MNEVIKSQNKVILEWLKSGKPITPMDALYLCGCMRLSARIYDLRERGFPIKKEMVCINNKRVAKYYLPI